MTIGEILTEARLQYTTATFSSELAGLYAQNESTILYWIFVSKDTNHLLEYTKILNATDWKFDDQ